MTTSWSPKDPVNSPVQEMSVIDPCTLSAAEVYKVMINAIIPRPIAFISTMSTAGMHNLAPFSFFNGVCSNPPTLMVSIARKPNGEKKDTLRNIEETGQFVVNSVNRWIAEPMVYTAGAFPYGESEFEITGLTSIPSKKVKPYRVKESAVHFECELLTSTEIGDGSPGSATVVFGKIVLMHVMTEAFDARGGLKTDVLDPVARLGGISYAMLGEQFQRAVPKVDEY